MKSRASFSMFQLTAGSCDALTGVLLMVAPSFALRWMGVQRLPTDITLVSFIGAFVFSVGLSYLIFWRFPDTERQIVGLQTMWLVTGIERLCVALFVAIACFSGRLEPAWISVSIVDFCIAVFQFTFMRRGPFAAVP